jgi:hypothetical protein
MYQKNDPLVIRIIVLWRAQARFDFRRGDKYLPWFSIRRSRILTTVHFLVSGRIMLLHFLPGIFQKPNHEDMMTSKDNHIFSSTKIKRKFYTMSLEIAFDFEWDGHRGLNGGDTAEKLQA